MNTGLSWELLDFDDGRAIDSVIRTARTASPSSGIGARFFDLDWKMGPAREWRGIRPYVLRRGQDIVAFAPFMGRDRPLAFHFGEVAIGSVALRRYCLFGDVHFAQDLSRDDQESASAALLEETSKNLQRHEALFFEGLPLEGPTYAALKNTRAKHWTSLEIGRTYEHQFIALPKSFDEYLRQMGSKSRQSVQYSARRLERDMDGAIEMVRYESPDSVASFLEHAVTISAKTYQTQLLGLGIQNDGPTRETLAFAANRGWFRSYVLFARSRPTAFMLSHQYGDCFYYDDVGYDPEFSKWSVGSVLQIKVLEDLIGSPQRPTYFDFSTGFGAHKGRFGNMSRSEVNTLVLPRTVRNTMLTSAYHSSEWASSQAATLLDRLGLKARLKKLVRRWKST